MLPSYHPSQVWSSYGRPEAKALHTWREAARTHGEARRRIRNALGRAMRPEVPPPAADLNEPYP